MLIFLFNFSSYHFQIGLYNSMVEKDGTKCEENAKKAYKAARMDSDLTAEKTIDDKVSSALTDRVIISVDSSVTTVFNFNFAVLNLLSICIVDCNICCFKPGN